MSENISFATAQHPTMASDMWGDIKCRACLGALEGACVGLIIGGAIIAAPTEVTAAGVVAALAVLGFSINGKTVVEWIIEAGKAGINEVPKLAKFICKKVGACS